MPKEKTALTAEQYARWDTLHADMTRTQRKNARPSEVTRFEHDELQETSFTIKEGYHTKRECKLWIVQLAGRVDRSAFNELKTKAKMLGGWWSSFRKSDAGFQFLSEESAARFTELLQGNVDRSDVLEGRKSHREQTAAERLHELAAEMLKRADETLQQSHASLQNTARRADIQAGVRGRAHSEAAMARTMHSVAEALSRGEAQLLDGIRHRTHLETLDSCAATRPLSPHPSHPAGRRRIGLRLSSPQAGRRTTTYQRRGHSFRRVSLSSLLQEPHRGDGPNMQRQERPQDGIRSPRQVTPSP